MKLPILMGASALTWTMLSAAPAQSAETILFNCFFPPQHYVCQELIPELAKRVGDATEGRVRVRVPPRSLTAPPDVYDGVVGGVMDGGIQFNAFLEGQVPGIQFSLLPFLGQEDAEASSVALWRTYQKFFGDKDEYGEVILLSLHATSGADFYSMTNRPIEAVADIAGRKMWGLPGTVANTLIAAGSPVVAGPAVQMLELVSKGVVDGYAGISLGTAVSLQLTDYTRSVTEFEAKVFQPTFSYFVSRSIWEKIAAEDQKAIQAVMGESFARYAGSVENRVNENAKASMEKAGVDFLPGNPQTAAQLIGYGQPMVDAWVARVASMGIDGSEVISSYRAAYDEALNGKAE